MQALLATSASVLRNCTSFDTGAHSIQQMAHGGRLIHHDCSGPKLREKQAFTQSLIIKQDNTPQPLLQCYMHSDTAFIRSDYIQTAEIAANHEHECLPAFAERRMHMTGFFTTRFSI